MTGFPSAKSLPKAIESFPAPDPTQNECQCPIWVQGTLHGKWLKKSLDLRNWGAAQELVRDCDGGHAKTEDTKAALACEVFLKVCEARNLSEASLDKYTLLTKELKEAFGTRVVGPISLPDLQESRESWKMAPVSSQKKLERLLHSSSSAGSPVGRGKI
jgi:hypothetical protein